jgi:HK97 family phage prohead protease
MNDKLFTKAEIERTDKGLVAVATTAVEDRHGEVVTIEGWDTKNFKKNPILLWAHDHTEPAIGVAKNLRLDGAGKKAKMVFEPVFHDLTDKAKALKSMVEEGIINSFSVGFRPLEMEGNTYTKQELLEISLVNVPANPDARMMAYKSLKAEGFDDAVIKEVGAWVEAEEKVVDHELEALKDIISQQQEKIDELVKGLKHLNPQGRMSEVVTQRLALSKVVARAADKLLEDKPKAKQANLAKVIKRASEKLIVDHKQELKLNGKN